MSIQTGRQAPDFTLYSDEMEPFRLSDHQGEPVVLLFFPGAFTSVCTDELCMVSDRLEEDFAGAQVVGISTDAPPALAEFRRANGLSIPLLSDHDADVSAMYGAKYDSFLEAGFSRIAKRAAFVVGTDGTVRYAEVLDDAGQQPDFEAVQRALDEG
ncbi:MAG: anti-oxidant AhpCTSA family protein [Bacteroidetes bacterium QS_8_68_15]|nr:MAG: anti-oxidant AhpCTSA family protein [Bacteroidetes bacterium QS_8_68_15]